MMVNSSESVGFQFQESHFRSQNRTNFAVLLWISDRIVHSFSRKKDWLVKAPKEKCQVYRFGFLLTDTPYHMKTLAMTGIIAPQAVRDNTLIRKPSTPVTTFTGES